MVCYHCQHPEHMRRDCPQRQGSQGFGTSQSQSTMGHRSPNQRWDRRGYSIFLHSPVLARGASISFKDLHVGVLMRRDNSRATRTRLGQNSTRVSSTRARLEMLTSRVEQLVTRLEKLVRNSNIFLYKILKLFF